MKYQTTTICNRIHEDPYLKDGNFSILAFSQGSILAKSIIEYCPLKMPVRSLVTFGGPHMGVSVFPKTPLTTWKGVVLSWLVDRLAYWGIFQWLIAPSSYWRDPKNLQGYLKYSTFLAEANNERNFNQTRKDMWLSLKHARFIKWEEDTMIDPNESSWWGEYTKDMEVLTRFETEVYQKDLIGIRTLEEEKRADFIAIPGDHMDFTHEQVNKLVEEAFIK